jgi:DNA replication and repair protein RecF
MRSARATPVCQPRRPEIYLSKLSLTSFRNHSDTRLELGPGLTVFHGANGQGKSNLLEAAYMLAIAKSPRAASDRELVSWSIAASGGHVQALGVGREGDVTTQAQIDIDVAAAAPAPGLELEPPLKKSLRVNGIIRPAVEFVGMLNVVFFEAADLEIVFGGPAERRRFLDILISQTDSSYLKAMQRYSRVVMQRNQLLRRIRDDRAGVEELEFWDDRLAVEGAAIIDRRRRAVAALESVATAEHAALTEGREQLGIAYLPRLSAENGGDPLAADADLAQDRLAKTLAGAMAGVQSREVAQGVSLVGPHRDDIRLTINGQPADAFASRGQARSVALALKLAEAASLKAATRRRPVLALDDVLSELDSARRRLVLERASHYEQALLTVTEPEIVAPDFLRSAAMFSVCAGKVTAAA